MHVQRGHAAARLIFRMGSHAGSVAAKPLGRNRRESWR
jgi:hypothetical protein